MNQYREGKVKSTGMTGVKQFLKPDAYKQSEVRGQEPGVRCQEARFLIPDAWLLAPD